MIQDIDEKVIEQNVNPDILKIAKNIQQYMHGMFIDFHMLKNNPETDFNCFRIKFRTLYYDDMVVYILIPSEIDIDRSLSEEENTKRWLQVILDKIVNKLTHRKAHEWTTGAEITLNDRRALHEFDRIKSVTPAVAYNYIQS